VARTYHRARTSRRKETDRPARLPKSYRNRQGGSSSLKVRVARWVGIFFLCMLVGGIGFAAGGYLGLVRSVDDLQAPRAISTRPTYIYSAPLGETDGSRRVIGTIFQSENRKTVPPDEMPPSLLNALVAKEDERFMEHSGVDVLGIMRALYVDLQEGARVEGASTITQQYVKNAYLSNERSISRKVKEALIAVEIERRYKKDTILGFYLNTVYFGNNAYGAEAASETYFNKSVEDLTTGESATLIGILWSPSTLGTDRDAAREQRDLVLEKMFSSGYITEQDYYASRKETLPEKWPVAPTLETGLTGPQMTRGFVDMVQQRLVEDYGATTVKNGGLDVYTTLDLEKQAAAQEIMYGQTGHLPNPDDPDAALVSIEPETGKIRAMVGNRDPAAQFNLVTQARRQPGSSFKTFALIAALEQGLDPYATRFVSEDKVYHLKKGNGTPEKWKVKNYEKAERGEISVAEALWQSDNTVFTDLVMNVGGRGLENGPEQIADVARRLGITADFGQHPHPSVVLGTQEVSPMEMATAYATIANEGRRVHPTVIEKVVKNEGQDSEEVLLNRPEQPEGKQVIAPEVARKATEIMIGDVTNGIAGKAGLGPQPVAGKTGTSERFFDAWFVGFTPQLTTGVWMGYGEGGQTLESLLGPEAQALGINGPSPTEIWHDYMQEALAGERIEEFEGVEDPPASTGVTAAPDTPVEVPAQTDTQP
jgi:membrane peptidoglycan carboxypeptidase